MIKLKIREASIHYAKNKSKKIREREKALEKTISRLEKEIDKETSEPGNVDLVEKLNDLKSELEKIIELRTKGAILRSKIRWYNEGEKNTKYFLNLEKRHCKEGTISQLKQDAKNFVTSDQEILAECQSFYMNLYAANVHAHPLIDPSDFFRHKNDTVLNEEEQKTCKGSPTEKECLAALKTMETGKTPGSNGLPAEFYKVFWKDISKPLIKALNFSYDTGCLSITQKRGIIIKLIPKKDTEPHYIKNWRPLTLVNCDYKLAAKSIANRLKNVLPSIISYDQTGFIKDRFIGKNIRLIDSVIRFAKERNIPGLLLFQS